MTPTEALTSELSDDELREAGYFVDDPPDNPLELRWDPSGLYDPVETECGLMGEDREGIWTRLQLDLIVDLEPAWFQDVLTEYACLALSRLTTQDYERRSAREFDALGALLDARAREDVRRGDRTSDLKKTLEDIGSSTH